MTQRIMSIVKTSLGVLGLALILSACNPKEVCQSQYTTSGEIDACVEGNRLGSVYAGQVMGSENQGAGGYLAIRQLCESQCKASYSGKARKACTESCQVSANYVVSR